MLCPFCHKDIPINKEFCPYCGQRVTMAFDQIAASVDVDAATRRGLELERILTWTVGALALSGVVLWGLNDIWDQPLVFDGADLPAILPPPAKLSEFGEIKTPLRSWRPVHAPAGRPPRGFGYRQMPLREKLREANGGGVAINSAIDKALSCLQRFQGKDGSWSVTAENLRIKKERDESAEFLWGNVGLTSLSLLAYFGAGETWLTEDKKKGKFAPVIEKGVAFLVQSQDEATGRIGPPNGNFMYNHGLATQALAEAAGMSGDPFLREAAQKGVDLIERIQGDKGGWGYRDQLGARQDTSVSAWQVQALLAAREAGLKVNPEVLQKALKFYQDATDPRTSVVAYDFNDRQYRPGLVGVALMLRQLLGESSASAGIKRLAAKATEAGLMPRSVKGWGKEWREGLTGNSDSDRATTFDPYRWYFATYGLFFNGGDTWVEWNKAMQAALLDLQDADGAWRGNDIWSVKVGAAYSTALCTLMLEVYYRIQ